MNLSGERRRWIAHLIAWLGGVLWSLSSYIHMWEILPHMPMRLGNGQLGFNLIIGAFLFLLGGAVGGYWWRFCHWLTSREPSKGMLLALIWFVFGLLAALGLMTQWLYGVGSVVILLGGIVYAFVDHQRQNTYLDPFEERPTFGSWFKRVNKYNLLFYLFFAVSLWANNVMAALKLDITTLELVSVIIGRLCFSCFLAVCLFLVAELTMRASPRGLRWVVWAVFAVLPLLILSDMVQSQMYGRGVVEIINNLTSNGSIDIEKELAAGGFGNLSVTMLLSFIAGGYLAAGLLAYLLWLLSSKILRGISMRGALLLGVMFYGLSVTEQAVGKYWKSLGSWQQEHKLFILQQGILKPKQGLALFKVEFKDPQFISSDPEARPKQSLPDIYFIMVESMRYDSVSAKTTPFLMEFRKDCQTLGATVAASNSTHLSWYSIFYSKPSIFWQEALLKIEDRDAFAGSPVLNEMHQLGYELNVRAVCDLGYKDFGLLNFGSDGVLCERIEQVVDGNELSKVNIPEREKIVFNRLKDSLLDSDTEGGNLYFTALDSPHYNYYWDRDFKVPYANYKEDLSFPLFPSKEEIRLYHNRYLNSVAWVDHQLEEFCAFLKKEGRYENSIIIITGDHGEEFQEDGGWCHCTSLMPEQTDVPIFIKWPADMETAPDQPVASHLDIFPSLFSYLGLPETTVNSMNGVNLFNKNVKNTAFVSTAFANKNGETMYLKNDDYTAYFSWARPWEPRVPDEIRLERIIDTDGNPINLGDVDYHSELSKMFPDVFERYFESLVTIE